MTTLVRLEGASKTYGNGVKTVALAPTTLEIPLGELVVILGPSGSGKSTLLNLMGALDMPTDGEVIVDGVHLQALSSRELSTFRRDKVGFIFQFYNLIPTLTAWENVELSAALSRRQEGIEAVLNLVDLRDVAHHFPAQLSGGQQQRVSIARALVKNPPLLLCDEPTGALDFETGKVVLGILESLVHNEGKTVVIVTHNNALAAMANRIIHLKDGQVVGNEEQSHPASAASLSW